MSLLGQLARNRAVFAALYTGNSPPVGLVAPVLPEQKGQRMERVWAEERNILPRQDIRPSRESPSTESPLWERVHRIPEGETAPLPDWEGRASIVTAESNKGTPQREIPVYSLRQAPPRLSESDQRTVLLPDQDPERAQSWEFPTSAKPENPADPPRPVLETLVAQWEQAARHGSQLRYEEEGG